MIKRFYSNQYINKTVNYLLLYKQKKVYNTNLYFQELGKKENKISRLSEEIYTYENNVNEKLKEISKIKQAYNELEVTIKVKLAF